MKENSGQVKTLDPSTAGPQGRPSHLLLRIVLTLLLVLVGLELGIRFAPQLRIAKRELSKASGLLNSQLTIRRSLQPDWGGGSLSLPNDSARRADVRGHDPESNRGFGSCPQSDNSGILAKAGVAIRKKPGRDYALTMAVPVSGQPGRTGRFELPSANHFKTQILPGAGDAEAPAADIPLYPQSSCRMQVGQGTACFTGFYLTPDSIEAVRSFYVRALSRFGWRRVTADRAGFLETFAKPNQNRTVVVQLRQQDSATTRIGLVATFTGSPVQDERK
jgi:hypothetical protein